MAAKEVVLDFEEGLEEIDGKLEEAEADMQAVRRQVADGEVASVIDCMQKVLLAWMGPELAVSLI